ncbi:MAG TPA: bifunctional nuclease family protein [Ignavibacteriaceae bacterium]|nr:bifunctional nuclease family protein [Ignavibacteriaceae bacterium]
MQKVQCEILGLSSSPSAGGAYAILLKESDGARRLPIIIGAFEAQAIALEIEGIKPPRPLTHDLLKQVIENLGATINEVVIDELRENTFYAKIIVEISGLTNEIDSRPSDAIALAVRTQSPIYVMESVMETAAFIPSDESEKDSFEEKEELHDEKESQLPKTKEAMIASLQNKLREAIESEEYERAAKLRDDIQRLSGSN